MEPVLTELASGLEFPEGPVFLADGSLIIVEIAAGCVSRIMLDGRKHIVAKPGGGPNGAALGPDGHLYICNSGGFAWERRKGLLTPVLQAEDYSGGRIERLNIDTGKVEVISTPAMAARSGDLTISSSMRMAASTSPILARGGAATWTSAACTTPAPMAA